MFFSNSMFKRFDKKHEIMQFVCLLTQGVYLNDINCVYIYIYTGMENLGVSTYDRKPPGTENDCIDVDTFLHEA